MPAKGNGPPEGERSRQKASKAKTEPVKNRRIARPPSWEGRGEATGEQHGEDLGETQCEELQ